MSAVEQWKQVYATADESERRRIKAYLLKRQNVTKMMRAAFNVENAYEWIINSGFVNENGAPMEFEDRSFLIDPLCDESKLLAVLKCSQVGYSTISIFKSVYHNVKYGHNIIYTLPTDSDVQEFNKAKTNLILDHNPGMKATMIEDSLHSKAFRTLDGNGVGFTFYKGTYGQSAAIMQTADILIKDEFDRSNQSVLNAYKSRIKASAYAAEWEFSNPSFPGYGVDITWGFSDQKHYFHWCPKCNHAAYITYEQESFDRGNTHHVDKERKEYVCGACAEVLDRRTARKQWVRKFSNSDISGYWISQMCAPWISASELMRDEKLMHPDVFWNFDIGKPYASNSSKLDASHILKNIEYDEMGYVPKVAPGKYRTLGIDVGGTIDNPKFYCVKGSELGIDHIILLHGEEQLHNYTRMNNISMAVMDNAPYPEIAIRYANAFPGKVYRCVFDYNSERKQVFEGDYKTRIVNVHRTRIFDRVVDGYITGERKVYIDAMEPSLYSQERGKESLCKHWSAQRKIGTNGETKNDANQSKQLKFDKMGQAIPQWTNDGADHFSLSDVYNEVARLLILRNAEGVIQ